LYASPGLFAQVRFVTDCVAGVVAVGPVLKLQPTAKAAAKRKANVRMSDLWGPRRVSGSYRLKLSGCSQRFCLE
jgi:hypothetical protein